MSVIRDTSERRQHISALLRERGSVQVAPLAARFAVSMQTIRKDLLYLEKRGVAERSYGGAISSVAANVPTERVIEPAVEPALETKRASNIDEKSRIGALAAAMVRPGESIVLDSGTTTLQIAEHLPDDEDITVLTNDLGILCALARKEHIKVVMLGGALRRRNRAFYGAKTENALDDLQVDKLFLGVDGFDIERGITTHYEPEAMLNRKMVKAARQVIAVTDRSKFGRVCLHRILNVGEIDDLVTDAVESDGMEAAAERLGFRLHIV